MMTCASFFLLDWLPIFSLENGSWDAQIMKILSALPKVIEHFNWEWIRNDHRGISSRKRRNLGFRRSLWHRSEVE